MKKTLKIIFYVVVLFINCLLVYAQPPRLYIQLVSHNEPSDSLQQPFKYQLAKTNLLHLAHIADSKNVKWNLQTSDGMVFGARQDEINTGNNIFRMLANPPYDDNVEIDPRNKNFAGRNIADQWYLLDSLGANPTKTVGGFIYYVCPPGSSSLIDWWQYTDTVTGLIYGNKIKFNMLSGAGSLPPHCDDLNDFGIFKPDTSTNFYQHNPTRNLWCIGTGCAPLLDSLSNELAVIDLIRGQVDSIQNGLWPADRFYVTRIMTNQREYGPMFFQKITRVIDSLNLIPPSKLKWATLNETFSDFVNWQSISGFDHSQWQCGESATGINDNNNPGLNYILSNNSLGKYKLTFADNSLHKVSVFNLFAQLILDMDAQSDAGIDLSNEEGGIYFIYIDNLIATKIYKP